MFGFGKGKEMKALKAQLAQVQQMLSTKFVNGGFAVWPDYTRRDHADSYCTTDDVYSVIKLIAQTAAAIPVYTYIKDSKGEEIDAPDNDPLKILVEQPFEGMSEYESRLLFFTVMLAQGEFFAIKFIPDYGPNKGKTRGLTPVMPQDMVVKVSDTFPRKVIAYQYAPEGRVVIDNISPEMVIHWKFINFKQTWIGEQLRGLSPLSALAKRLTRLDSNMEATTAQLQNGGVPGIVFEKGPIPPGSYNQMPAGGTKGNSVGDVLNKMKADFFRYLTNSANKGAPFFAGGDMGYIQLGLKLADMEAENLAKLDFKKLCNAYSVSDRLFNNDATGSEVSDKGARVGLYTNAVMPLVKMFTDGLELGLAKDFGPNYCIEGDFSEVSELQINYGEMVTWLEKAWWLTPNEKREMMLFEKSTEPMFDQYIVPQGQQLLSDLELPPVDINPQNDPGQSY